MTWFASCGLAGLFKQEVKLSDSAPRRSVYVVDDDRDVRLSLAFQLRTMGYEPRPFVAATDFLAEIQALSPGCVLLDVRMAGMDGVQAIAELRRLGNDWPVIVMTGHAAIAIAVEVMKSGAVDFLEKPFDEQQLQGALENGFAKLDRDRDQQLADASATERLARLSPREVEVLRMLLAGEQNKMVAHSLQLSIRTVEMHRANLLAKLEVRSVAEAAALAGNRLP